MAEEDVPEAEEGKKKGGKLKLIILIVVGVLLIAALSIFGTWFMLKDKLAGPDDMSIDEMAMSDPSLSAEQGEALYFAMDPAFIINYTNGGKSRFLQVELTLLTRDPEALAVIEQHNPLIRNNLLDVFSMQDISMLATAEGKQKLAEELAAAVQAILDVELGRPGVESVLYRSFIIQ
ncbi:flagellar basal body-associated FliL family protein [Reinekea marinisedimentorum]|uniref:Flagellar protein FliL n=1 Tax=Reinekea marinisedimentorum TaxID=230495 RepID=A0A4R3I846_9GAMM|nr:flagellar basal body-associated FliL family protein [Reinekea marinisedimentorum]TCS42422.1 flagellar FliL protein [Reinekea marinisedimentorum]